MTDEAPRDLFDKIFGWRKRAPAAPQPTAPPDTPLKDESTEGALTSRQPVELARSEPVELAPPEPAELAPLPPEFVPASAVIPEADPEPAAAAEVAASLQDAREEFGRVDPDPVPSIVEEIRPDLTHTATTSLSTSGIEDAPAGRRGWLQRLTGGLRRSSDQLSGNIASVFTKARLDEQTLYDLEDVLVGADLGVETALAITETLRRERFDRSVTGDDVRRVMAREVAEVLEPVARPLVIDRGKKPFVILMIGVNGSGKTTTIGKLSQKFTAEGLSVMLAAGDTFRAAAIEQLEIWGQRTGAPVITKPAGSDASGLAFEAVTRARAEGRDVLIIDTAGRLQNRVELMGELQKIIRVIRKVDPEAPHATLLTLDATTGQNALNQVEIFGKTAGVTGLVMTKLDGTARGGILVAIAQKFKLPVHFIGVGEQVNDLEPFEAGDFATAIAGGTRGAS